MKFPAPEFDSSRSPVIGTRGMVATSQPLATAAGLEILARGGNAADAAVAAAAALNVTEPTSTGIGGDMFALFWDAREKKVTALNGSGRAPAALTLDKARAVAQNGELPPFHPYTITVPGACAGWCDLIERHGSLAMGDILSPAIRLASDGFPVAPLTSHFWQRGAERQLQTALNGKDMTLHGRAPNPGEIFFNNGLADTLRKVAEHGKNGFYTGEIAEAIASTAQAAGGVLSVEDLQAHTSTWDTPIFADYKKYRVYECPPNGQGIVALMALSILAGFDLENTDPLSPDRLHYQIEALRLAFADARQHVADPAYVNVPAAELLSWQHTQKRRAHIHPARATPNPRHGTPFNSSDTVYLSVMDQFGNACSFINSNYMGFGTGIVPGRTFYDKGWGFTLQNRGHNFSLEAGHPNALAPGKRPYHTIIPAMATWLDKAPGLPTHEILYASFGVMGGFMQPQGHVQVFLNLVENDLNPQSALDLPRFCIDVEQRGGLVLMEKGMPQATLNDLARRGHPIKVVEGYERAVFGRGQVIVRTFPDGVLIGGSDPRADGCAMTLA